MIVIWYFKTHDDCSGRTFTVFDPRTVFVVVDSINVHNTLCHCTNWSLRDLSCCFFLSGLTTPSGRHGFSVCVFCFVFVLYLKTTPYLVDRIICVYE